MLIHTSQVYAVYHVHARQPAWRPPTDVYETENELVVQIEIAGMRDGHFHLSVQDRLLIVHGSRADGLPERRAYHQMEINTGDFWTEIELPFPVEADSVRAEYDDGFLRIALPKIQLLDDRLAG